MTTYSKNTIRQLERLLGYGIACYSGEKTFRVVDNVLYTDVFEDDEPTINGYSGEYVLSFNGKRDNVDYYNQIELLDDCLEDEYTIDTEWGSESLNSDIDELLAYFETKNTTANLGNVGILSKKIEDYSVNFRTATEANEDMLASVKSGWSYYVRNPIIIGVSAERRDDGYYF